MDQATFSVIASHLRASTKKPDDPGTFEVSNGVYAIPVKNATPNLWYQGKYFSPDRLEDTRCIASEIGGPNKRELPITRRDYETAMAVFGEQR